MGRFARTLAIIGVAASLGLPASAEAAVLEAARGSDRAFTLSLTPPNGWNVQQFEDLIEVRFPGLGADLTLPTAIRPPVVDLSTQVDGGDTYLRFTVDCSCSLVIMANPSGGLAMEFIERPKIQSEPAPTVAPLPPIRSVAVAAATPASADPVAGVDVVEARKRLMKQLKRAAEAGLIELDGVDPPETEKPAETTAAETKPVATDPRETGGTSNGGSDGPPTGTKSPNDIKKSAPDNLPPATATDTSPTAPLKPEDGSDDKKAPETDLTMCHDSAVFDFPRITSADEWIERVGALRAAMIGEFDRPTEPAVFDLVRVYLSGGLADEAIALIDDFASDSAVGSVLRDVAVTVAGRPVSDGAALLRPDCLGAQALWRAAALSIRGGLDDAMAAERESGRAVEKLPPGLRREIAARLGLAAADAGDWDGARRLHAMVLRSNDTLGGGSGRDHLLSARIAQWSEDPKAELQALTAARAGNPGVAAAATLILAESIVKSGDVARGGIQRLVTDLGLIARLNRGALTGKRAAALEVRLTDLLHGRGKALDLLTLGLALGDFDEAGFTETLSAMVKGGHDANRDSIAAIYLEDPEAFGPALDDPAFRAVLAQSLVRLGLPAQAANLYGDAPIPTEIAFVLAEGFLDVGDHRSAIAMIAELPESAERDRLHLLALARAGRIAKPESDPAVAEEDPGRLLLMARAAIAAGDLERALDLTLSRLKIAGAVDTAETAAMLALAVGRPAVPEAAAAKLKSDAPGLHDQIVALFNKPSTAMDPNDPTTAQAFLKRLDAEIAVIEDVLNDG